MIRIDDAWMLRPRMWIVKRAIAEFRENPSSFERMGSVLSELLRAQLL
jgi:hypothetical protein